MLSPLHRIQHLCLRFHTRAPPTPCSVSSPQCVSSQRPYRRHHSS